MPDAELRRRLEELHAELERTPSVDREARRLLEELAEEIRDTLDRAEAAEQEHASFGERLAEAVRDFEEDHPQLSAAIGRVANTLSNMGI